MIKILFIDDEWITHEILRSLLPAEFSLLSATHGIPGFELMKSEAPDIILLACFLPDINGLDLLEKITSQPASPPVIMLTRNTDYHSIVKAMRAGAFDYVVKPYEFEKLLLSLKKAALCSLSPRKSRAVEAAPLARLTGESRAMVRIKSLILRYASSLSPILITGESGTGKDLIAEIIHSLSPKKNGPFVRKNCGAIPDTLIDSELFGTEKGAYTDAVPRPGSFEQATDGTLFLNEIGEMNLASQVRLLTVIESKNITRLGGKKLIDVDVRIISATNKDLHKAVINGTFREDLLYRINTLMIHVPPLKDRAEDIPLIVSRLIQTSGVSGVQLHPSALDKLLNYPWPGNVRELKNVLDRASVMSDSDTIFAKDIVFYNSRI